MYRMKSRLGELMAELNLNDVDLVWMTGIRQQTIAKLITGYADRAKFEHLSLIMTELECDLSEIIEVEWVGEEVIPPREGRYERVNRKAAHLKTLRKLKNAEKRKRKAAAQAAGNVKPKGEGKANSQGKKTSQKKQKK